jgi:prepilin-type N-terminal cleavage/methylation domain-containing protein/prepilin-type processing-associated H-X9-DG protein
MLYPRTLLEKTSSPAARRGDSGFTLVELLIVFTIIAVLAAVILVAVPSVSSRAHEAGCVANLRQLGAANMAYVADNDGGTVPAAIQNGSALNGVINFETILVSRGYVGDCSSASPTQLPKASVFRCPAGLPNMVVGDRGKFSDPKHALSDDAQGYVVTSYRAQDGRTDRFVQSWYGINAIVNNFNPPFPFWGLQTVSGSNGWSINDARKYSSIGNPANVVGIYCGVGFHNGAIARVAARHSRRERVNVLFMDGHTSSLPINEVQGAFLEMNLPLDRRQFKQLSFTTL